MLPRHDVLICTLWQRKLAVGYTSGDWGAAIHVHVKTQLVEVIHPACHHCHQYASLSQSPLLHFLNYLHLIYLMHQSSSYAYLKFKKNMKNLVPVSQLHVFDKFWTKFITIDDKYKCVQAFIVGVKAFITTSKIQTLLGNKIKKNMLLKFYLKHLFFLQVRSDFCSQI